MKLKVEDVPATGIGLRWEEPAASIDARIGRGAATPGGASASQPAGARSPLASDLRAARSGRTVAVVGRVRATVGLACGRCLRAIEAPLDLPVAFMFIPPPPKPKPYGAGRAAPGDRRGAGQARRAEPDDDRVEVPLADIDLSGLPFELPREDLEVLEYFGPEIDLTQTVVDQVVLALPLQPLCAESCKGLCPQCGQDLNAANCGCAGDRVDPRFAALKSLETSR